MSTFVDIINRARPDGPNLRGAEIGVSCGNSSAALLRAFPELTLYMVDSWSTYPAQHLYRLSGDGHARLTEEEQAAHKQKALDATAFAGNRRTVLQMTSLEASWEVEDASLDWCIIDADHTFAAVMVDLHQWEPKLKLGGLLMGHDYAHPRNRRGLFGVDKAVKQYAERFGRVLKTEGDIWWFEPGAWRE